jgi:flagellin-like hook-associated protein FlgL
MSSSITLSAATRQNLLSLQDTASLLATTQTRLSTGKEVNSALDNPANFFTAQGLNQRSGTLTSLLDGISNGIQTIQAANTGLTNLQKLTDQLKSTAQQATQATSAVTAKATLTTKALNGAIDTNLVSTGATQATGRSIGAAATTASTLTGTVAFATATTPTALATDQKFEVDGVSVTVGAGNYFAADVVSTINAQLTAGNSNVVASANGGGNIILTNSIDGAAVSVSGTSAGILGASPAANTAAAVFSPKASTRMTSLGFTDGDNVVVNGYSVSISKTDTVSTFAQKVSTATNGEVTAAFDPTAANRYFTFTAKDAKTQVNLANGSTATSLISKIGFNGATSFAAGLGASGSTADLANKTLTVSVGSGASAKTATVTFGNLTGQVQTLDQLNVALASANAQATMDSTGRLSISTTNDSASQTLNISGTATGASASFLTSSAGATLGGDGLTARNKLVTDYNNLLGQIDQLSNDSSFNGINLLKGDQLKVNFNEDASSSITLKGVATNSTSLKLTAVTTDDFKVMDSVKSASTTLKSQAATYASNLSVVQNRQDFTKNLANVLDTGAANLTNADLNEEAANSQALSTRNSLAISALSLANQSQQGILQLLR